MHTEHVLEQIFALPVLLGQVMCNPESKKLLVPLESRGVSWDDGGISGFKKSQRGKSK